MFPIFVGEQAVGKRKLTLYFWDCLHAQTTRIYKLFFKSTKVLSKSWNLNKALPSKVVFQATFLSYLFEERASFIHFNKQLNKQDFKVWLTTKYSRTSFTTMFAMSHINNNHVSSLITKYTYWQGKTYFFL